jgi:hypothetical protein
VSTVLECPPTLFCFSKTVTLCRFESSHAADMPAMPVPITAMFRRDFFLSSWVRFNLDFFIQFNSLYLNTAMNQPWITLYIHKTFSM